MPPPRRRGRALLLAGMENLSHGDCISRSHLSMDLYWLYSSFWLMHRVHLLPLGLSIMMMMMMMIFYQATRSLNLDL